MNAKLSMVLVAAAMPLIISSPAMAAPLLFDFSGPSGTASFVLDSNPTPDFSSSFLGSDQFGFDNVSGTYGGKAGVASTIGFGNGLFASFNLTAANLGFTQFSNPTLFTGTAAMPVFAAGSYTLINPFFGNGNLTISQVQAGVPEPGTWMMMVAGFGAVGFVLRSRRRAAIAI